MNNKCSYCDNNEVAVILGNINHTMKVVLCEKHLKVALAAPELFEVCNKSLIEHEAIHEVMLLDPANRGMREAAIIPKLRAVIAKVTGK